MNDQNYNNLLIRFLNWMMHIVVLNLLVIMTSIPVITAGASLTAMHYVLLKIVKGEEGHIIPQYFQAFKDNLKQATVMWIGFLVVGLAALLDFRLLKMGENRLPVGVTYLMIFAALVVFYVALYAFPLLAAFHNTTGGTLRNAGLLWVYAFPRTILMAVLTLFPFVMAFLNLRFVIFLVLAGLSLPAYLCTLVRIPVFRKLEEAGEDSDQKEK